MQRSNLQDLFEEAIAYEGVPTSDRALFAVGGHTYSIDVQEAGHDAINTAGNDIAEIALKAGRDGKVVIPFLMNDAARRELEEACAAAGAAFYNRNRDGEVLIPNDDDDDDLAIPDVDRGKFCEVLDTLEREAADMRKELEDRANRKYLLGLGVHDVFDVSLEIASGEADREHVPTGLTTLDEALGDGLPMGALVTLGATSSTGKTTLALQIADHIAASGRPVLFVTIEQGRHELVAKSISRLMRLQAKKYGWYSVSSSDVQSTKARNSWDDGTWSAFNAACGDYGSKIAPNMYVMEIDKQPTTGDVRRAAEAIRKQRGQAPVVFVDYLQLLAPASDRMTDKQAVDHNVMDLRHLARDLVTCVFTISSLNRSSYSTGVNLESFKESGAVEYGSDVLLGMQPRSLMEKLDGVAEAKQKSVAREVEREFKSGANREVVVTVLKNRGGAVHPDGVPLDYSAISNLFTCAEQDRGRAAREKRVRL